MGIKRIPSDLARQLLTYTSVLQSLLTTSMLLISKDVLVNLNFFNFCLFPANENFLSSDLVDRDCAIISVIGHIRGRPELHTSIEST